MHKQVIVAAFSVLIVAEAHALEQTSAALTPLVKVTECVDRVTYNLAERDPRINKMNTRDAIVSIWDRVIVSCKPHFMSAMGAVKGSNAERNAWLGGVMALSQASVVSSVEMLHSRK